MSKPRGFTLIELMIAISIIAILSVIAVTVYGQVTMNARDARRKLDLLDIAQALEVYYQKNGRYPITLYGDWAYSSAGADDWIVDSGSDPKQLVPSYISSLPQDPKNSSGSDAWNIWNMDNIFSYAYCGGNSIPTISCYWQCTSIQEGQWYALLVPLENRNDPDRAEMKNYKWCNDENVLSVMPYFSRLKYFYIITPN